MSLMTVVDLFRRGSQIGKPSGNSLDLYDGFDGLRCDEQQGFELVKREVRKKPGMIEVRKERFFKVINTLIAAPWRERIDARKVLRQTIKVQHGRHRNGAAVAEEFPDIVTYSGVFGNSAFELQARFQPLGRQDDGVQMKTELKQLRGQHIPHERLLRLPFYEDVGSLHRLGLPPRRFFSQSSPRA